MRTFDRIIGIVITTASAIASTALLIYFLRTPTYAGDVIWPALLIVSISVLGAWIGVWAWANERWALAAPTIFLGALGSAGFGSFLAVIPIGFAGLSLYRAIRRRVRTA